MRSALHTLVRRSEIAAKLRGTPAAMCARMQRTHALILALVIFSPALARAQAEATTDAPSTEDVQTDHSPGARLDVFQGVGVGYTSAYDRPAFSIEGGVTLVMRDGNGVRVGVGYSSTDPANVVFSFGGTPASAHLLGIDAGYVRRFRLAGNDRAGLGLDLFGGMTAAHVAFAQASQGWCVSSCSQPPRTPEWVADGWHLGTHVGASLALRLSVFVIALDVRARALVALERVQPTDQLVQGDVTTTLSLGFGFY